MKNVKVWLNSTYLKFCQLFKFIGNRYGSVTITKIDMEQFIMERRKKFMIEHLNDCIVDEGFSLECVEALYKIASLLIECPENEYRLLKFPEELMGDFEIKRLRDKASMEYINSKVRNQS